MKLFTLLFLSLTACSIREQKAIDDFLEGETKTAEQVIQDLSAPDPITPPVMKFPPKNVT